MDAMMGSKTMKLVLLTAAAILLVFLVAALASAVLQINIPYVGETMAALTGNSGIGAARNAYVDAPARRANNMPDAPAAPPPNVGAF